MDRLLFAVRKHYAWEINVKTRMVSDDYQWNETNIVERLRTADFFNKQDFKLSEYTENELNLLNGKLSARTQP